MCAATGRVVRPVDEKPNEEETEVPYMIVDEDGNPVEARNAPWSPAGSGGGWTQDPYGRWVAPGQAPPMAPPPRPMTFNAPYGPQVVPPGYAQPYAVPQVPPGYPTYGTQPLAVPTVPGAVPQYGAGPFININGTGIDLGTLVSLVATGWAAFKELPAPPDMTGDQKTDMERLTAYFTAGMQHMKSDEKLRFLGDAGALLLAGRLLGR